MNFKTIIVNVKKKVIRLLALGLEKLLVKSKKWLQITEKHRLKNQSHKTTMKKDSKNLSLSDLLTLLEIEFSAIVKANNKNIII